jgi:hypothetical protein
MTPWIDSTATRSMTPKAIENAVNEDANARC